MKIRTLEKLCDALNHETAWRIAELQIILDNIQNSKGPRQEVALKAGVALLYAHWEGAIKQLASLYLEYVSFQRVGCNELKINFLASIWKEELHKIASEKSFSSNLQKLEDLLKKKECNSRMIIPTTVNTKSNLKSSIFQDITAQVGISDSNFSTYYKLIDNTLVETRNCVAHGEKLYNIDVDRYQDLHKTIIILIRTFSDLLSNEAATKSYKSSAVQSRLSINEDQ